MGAVIMTHADEVHLAPNGFIMIHAPSGGVYGNAKDMEQTAKLLRSMEKSFIARLVKLTGKTEDEVKNWMDGTDYWFPADEAEEIGLITSTISEPTDNVEQLEVEDVSSLGARGTYEKFAALTTSLPKTQEMDKKTLIARYGLTTVTEASTDEEVMQAIQAEMDASKTEADNAKQELEKKNKESITSAVKAAITAGKLPAEKEAVYIARGEKIGLEELNAILGDMQVYTPITGQIGANGSSASSKGSENRADWDFNKWQEEDPTGLKAMADSPKGSESRKKFDALYKAEFGC